MLICGHAPAPAPRASHPRRPISPRGWRKIRPTAKGERKCCCIMEHERVGEGDATLDCLQKEQTLRIRFRRVRVRARASQPHFDLSENLLSPPLPLPPFEVSCVLLVLSVCLSVLGQSPLLVMKMMIFRDAASLVILPSLPPFPPSAQNPRMLLCSLHMGKQKSRSSPRPRNNPSLCIPCFVLNDKGDFFSPFLRRFLVFINCLLIHT